MTAPTEEHPAAGAPRADLEAARRRARRKLLLKLGFSTVAVLWLFLERDLDLPGILGALSRASIPLLLVGVGLHIIGITLSAVRWRYLLLAQGTDVDVWVLAKYLLVSFFFNMFLPTNIGGDIMRIVDTSRHSRESVKPTAVILVERGSGLLTLLGFMVVVLVLRLPVGFDIGAKSPLLWLGVAYALGLTALLGFLAVPAVARIGFRIFELPGLNRVQGIVRRFYDAVMTYKDHPGLLLRALGTGLILQLNYVIYYVVVARALGISSAEAPAAFFFLVIPIRDVLLMIPLFINGLGIRENSDVTFFGWLGIGAGAAVAFSWLDFAYRILYALIGGVVYVLRGRGGEAA
jgi:hypothetical protein